MATVNLKSFPSPEEAACPKCKHEIRLYDPAGSEFCVCPNCHSFLRFIADDFAKNEKQVPPIKQQPVILLGSEGVLKNVSYKVIAYSEKKEYSNPFAWREYLLYNYEKGYANLAEYDGHWSLVAGKNFYPELDGLGKNNWDFIEYDGIAYSIYNKYTAVVTALLGEFDWDALSEKPKTTEFIAPPYIIFKEQDKPGTNHAELYLGEYTEAAEIAAAFKVDIKRFPAKIGIGANEFSRHYSRWYTVSRVTGILIVALLAIQLIIMFCKPEKVLLEHDFAISYDTTKVTDDFKSFATPQFKIADASSAVEVDVGSAVDNNWLEATITLVNEQTNQTWEVTEGIEYYHGYEDGENWTEGSQQTTVLLSAIPAGTYHLNVYPASGDRYRNNLRIRVTANITLWMNLFLTCLALCIYPFYCWVHMRNFEKQRWMNSDYSPYEANE
jgi:hypothetical protein